MLNRKILLVGDPDAILVFKDHLENIGYQNSSIICCHRYDEVLSYKGSSIDVVITDLSLPDCPADHTFEKIKRLFPYSPVIIVTGKADKEAAIRAIEHGAEDYLARGNIDKNTFERSVRYAIARKQSANDYRRLFNENPAPMYIMEAETRRFLAVNTAALHQYGYTKEEFLALTGDQIRPEEDRLRFLDAIKGVKDDYRDYGRWRHQKKNGELFYVHVYAHNIFFEGKDAKVVMAINVNKQVEAEDALRHKMEENEIILQSITDSFFTVDSEHRVSYVNKTFETVMQVSSAEVVGRDLWEAFPVAAGLKFKSEYDKMITDRRSVHFEAYYPPLEKWLQVNGYPSEAGAAIFFMDITEQRKLQEQVYFNERNLSAIINNTTDLIWSVDKDLKIITANNNFYERFRKKIGKPAHELRQSDFEEIAYREWEEDYARAFSGESFKVIRREFLEHKVYFEEVSFNPILDNMRQLIGISCFARDITEIQQHIFMIEEQNAKLKQINWFQSHELRKPVANILGLAALINIERLSEPENVQLLQYLQVSAMELDKVIKKIIDAGN
jgi:PAS domain S-box-containing protein